VNGIIPTFKTKNKLFLSQNKDMKELFGKHKLVIIFSAAGAIGGYLYWKFVGCQSGTCPIKSVWYLTTFWGLLVGYLTGSILKDFLVYLKKKNKINDEDNM
jgi:hypothetical protein